MVAKGFGLWEVTCSEYNPDWGFELDGLTLW